MVRVGEEAAQDREAPVIDDNPMLRAALAYVARGQKVLPIEPAGKIPIVEFAPHAVHSASADPRVVRDWFERAPSANLAIAVPESYRVLDIDPRHGGDVALLELLEEHGALPATVTASTGGGGEHRLFRFPAGEQRFKLREGLELLRPGRYYLAWPSRTTGPYRWSSPKGTAIANAPKWLVDLARVAAAPAPVPRSQTPREDNRVERARKYMQRVPGAISGSGGSTHTLTVAQKLVHGFELDMGEAWHLLVDWNQTCQPPWSEKDLRRKLDQALQHGRMQPGALRTAERRR